MRRALVSCVVLVLGGACAPTSSSSSLTSSGEVGVEAARIGAASNPALDLLHRMHDAPDTTAFSGTRTVELHRDGETYEFVEAVGADGTGAFAVEVPSVQRVPSALDPIVARLLLQQRGAFAHRARDPRITDVAEFLAQWNAVVASRTVVVAGHDCWRLEVSRKQALTTDPVRYELDVEPRTGFIVAWRESDSSGQLLSSVEYTTLDFGADVSHMALARRAFPVTVLDAKAGLPGQIGAAVLEPDLAPPGFSLEAVELIEPEPGVEWLKFVYTDGFERAYFLHRVDRSGTLPQPTGGRVDHAPFGPWTFAVGEVAGYDVIAGGKLPAMYLGDLIQSSLR